MCVLCSNSEVMFASRRKTVPRKYMVCEDTTQILYLVHLDIFFHLYSISKCLPRHDWRRLAVLDNKLHFEIFFKLTFAQFAKVRAVMYSLQKFLPRFSWRIDSC